MNRQPSFNPQSSDEVYRARCLKTLKDWGAPLTGWYCTYLIDVAENSDNTATCELCGCTKVRFIHLMNHKDYPRTFEVGCICAGLMEDDILAAKDRERLARNRHRRRTTFCNKGMQPTRTGNFKITHRAHTVFINHARTPGTWYVNMAGTRIFSWHGKPIRDLRTAQYAAFDLIDPKPDPAR
ncbi:hypothetical protein [Arcanobacterium hippocoleae]|uniref:hypothetical protein n=1 Tax=Arcanobacterium hippocoleae TaxID=149017 RepID=UPI00333E8A6A